MFQLDNHPRNNNNIHFEFNVIYSDHLNVQHVCLKGRETHMEHQ